MSCRGSPEAMGMSAMSREVTGRRAAGSGRSRNWRVQFWMLSAVPLVAGAAGAVSSFCVIFQPRYGQERDKSETDNVRYPLIEHLRYVLP